MKLTAREFALLEYLMRKEGNVASKTEILDHVWGIDFAGDPNVVEVYVGYLRKKIDAPFGLETVQTVRGAGYLLERRLVTVRWRLTLIATVVFGVAFVAAAFGLVQVTRNNLVDAIRDTNEQQIDQIAAQLNARPGRPPNEIRPDGAVRCMPGRPTGSGRSRSR